MKWFKHMTNSSLDERLARFTDKYGLEAYGFFWRVLEAIAANVDETNRKHIQYSTKTWCKLLGIRPQTFRKLIQESSVLGLFQVSFNSDLVTVESPNILKYRDEWTRKKSRTPEQNSEKDKEKEGEKKEEKKPRAPSSPAPKKVQPKPEKKKYGANGNVMLTDEEHSRLCENYTPELTEKAIALLDLHIGAKGKDEYKNHSLAMQKWVFDAVREREARSPGSSRASPQQPPVKSWIDRESEANMDAFRASVGGAR